MVDYLHLEILRSLAHDDDRLLGAIIRGPWFEYDADRFELIQSLVPESAACWLLAGGAWAAEPTLAELGQGINAYNSRDFTGAISHLRAARSVTALSDYVTYHLAYSEVLTGDVDGALGVLTA